MIWELVEIDSEGTEVSTIQLTEPHEIVERMASEEVDAYGNRYVYRLTLVALKETE